jgi:hypothetical protein
MVKYLQSLDLMQVKIPVNWYLQANRARHVFNESLLLLINHHIMW